MAAPDSMYDDHDAIDAAVAEGHHSDVVGGLWQEVGTLQFEFLKRHGLRPEDHLLDIGCGSLRAGVHFAAYLHPGHYWGIDSNKSLLDAGRTQVLTERGLANRVPLSNLLHDDAFEFERFGRLFDVAIAQSLFPHLSENRVRLCLFRLARVMRPGSRFFATHFDVPETHPLDQPYVHSKGGVRSFRHKDPFHYPLSAIDAMIVDLPWRIARAGDWDHPRDQKMIIFERLPEPQVGLAQPDPAIRLLNLDGAALLPAGADHYRAYVGPPDRFDFIGASQFALLFTLGLRDHHAVLDFGCGSLRLGRLLIPYLRPNRYFGIDPNSWLIEDGLLRELGRSALRAKQPAFSYNDDFRCDVFERQFDFIVAQSILTHCGRDLSQRLLREMAKALVPSGIIVFSVIEATTHAPESQDIGWVYPACVAYRQETFLAWCNEAGLAAKRLAWYHPGAVWYIAAHDPARIPTSREMPALTGSVLFDPQFAASRPPRVSDAAPSHAKIEESLPIRHNGLGTATLQAASPVQAGGFARFAFIYTVGPAGLMAGGRLRIACRHMSDYSWSAPQTTDPAAPGYVTARASTDAALRVRGWAQDTDFAELFPWQFAIEVAVDAALAPGTTIEVVYGETNAGGPGAMVQFFGESNYRFRVFADPTGYGRFQRIDPDLAVPIVAGPPEKLVAVVRPSRPRANEPVRITIRAEDRFGNVAHTYTGQIKLTWTNGGENQTCAIDLGPRSAGIVTVDNIAFSQPGLTITRVSDGRFSAEANPVEVVAADSDLSHTFWGELHGHTLASDGRGTLEQYYDYAEHVAALDVCAVTDHDFMISDALWAESKRVTNCRNQPGRFVTINAFEWSGRTDVGGDHNVYFADDDPPIIRSRPYYDYRNARLYHGQDAGANHIEDLFNALALQCVPERVFTAPHFGGRPANSKWVRREFDRFVEIFSEHQNSETWALPFLTDKLGVVGGGDDHIGRPGNGFLHFDSSLEPSPYGRGLVAVEALALTRAAIFDALYHRRVYATTGARILLRVSVAGAAIGSEIKLQSAPTINVEVVGTAAITVVQILKNWAVIHEQVAHPYDDFDGQQYLAAYPDVAQARGNDATAAFIHYCQCGFREGRKRYAKGTSGASGKRSMNVTWTDPQFTPHASVAYVVRVVQGDNSIAVSSPVWVN